MMLGTLMALAALAATPQGPTQTDTTFTVPAGTRLSLANIAGDVVIRTWNRNQVRVQASHSERAAVEIQLSGSVLRLGARSGRGAMAGLGRMADFQLTVPAAMALDLQGMYMDVTLEGTRGDVKVNTVEGELTVRNSEGTVSLTTINGKIDVRGSRGRLELRSTSEDIIVSDAQGDLLVETVSGDISLRRIDARRVEAQTVSGDVEFEGTVRAAGSYSLLTHSGDITFAVPDGTNATLRAAVASGDIEATFALPTLDNIEGPGRNQRSSRRRQVYRLGNGSATVELETFSGDVRLVRPAELNPGRNQEA